MLSEKELAKEIMRQQWGCEGAIWKGLPLEVVQEWGETISYWLEIANNRAAHAIAEKLREGVVWEATGYVGHLNPTHRTFDGTTTEIGDGGDYWYGILSGWIGEDGQLYRVTVTKEEPCAE